jgi:hypothetical protein
MLDTAFSQKTTMGDNRVFDLHKSEGYKINLIDSHCSNSRVCKQREYLEEDSIFPFCSSISACVQKSGECPVLTLHLSILVGGRYRGDVKVGFAAS